MNSGNENLDYISSSPYLVTPKKTKPIDELQISTIRRVQDKIEDQIELYSRISSLSLDESPLTIKEQLAVNKSVVFHLEEIRAITEATINDINEKYKIEGEQE